MMMKIIFFAVHLYKSSIVLTQSSDTLAKTQELGPLLEPDPVKFSYDTPGWYFLGIVTILVLSLAILRWYRHYRENTYRREAINEINQLNMSSSQHEILQRLTELLIILKLVALKTYGREEVAALHGKPWLLFLDSKTENTSFSEFEPLISKATYQSIPLHIEELEALKNLSKKWIQNHA